MSVCGVRCVVLMYTADWCVGYVRIMWDNVGYYGIFWDIWSLMFFWKAPPQTEGRRNADLLIKTPPDLEQLVGQSPKR